MSSYAITFNTGFYGTWLVWFISQHRHFKTAEFEWRYNHFNNAEKRVSDKPVHMQLHGHEWYYDIRADHMQDWSMDDEWHPQLTLKEYLELHEEFEKFAFKPTPHHHWDHMNDSAYRGEIMHYSKYIICAWFTNMQPLADRLSAYSWDHVGHDKVEDYIIQTNNQANTLGKLTDGLVVDMGKLLGTDEEASLDEYWRILQYTESPGIQDWKELKKMAIV